VVGVESANYLTGEWPNLTIVEADMGAKRFCIYDEWFRNLGGSWSAFLFHAKL
jgi:hypothetical protein